MLKQLLDANKDNYLYAPGIATYGIDGKDGVQGAPGNCIFYSNYTIETSGDEATPEGFVDFLNLIVNNVSLVKNNNTVLSRPYISGDYIIFSSGHIYRMLNVDELRESLPDADPSKLSKEDYFEFVGKLTTENDSSNYFQVMGTNRLALNSSMAGLDMFYKNADVNTLESSPAMQETDDYILRIIGEKGNTSNKVFFISLSSKYNTDDATYMNLYYDETDSAFHIDSNKDILIKSKSLQVDTEADVNSYDNYSSVMTWDNPDTEFIKICKNFCYQYNNVDKILTLSYTGDDFAEDVGANTERFDTSLYLRTYDTANNVSKFNRYELVFNNEDRTLSTALEPIDVSNAGDEIVAVSFIYNIECFIKQDTRE